MELKEIDWADYDCVIFGNLGDYHIKITKDNLYGTWHGKISAGGTLLSCFTYNTCEKAKEYVIDFMKKEITTKYLVD